MQLHWQELPRWVTDLGFFRDTQWLEFDEEKSFFEIEEDEEVVQIVFMADKEMIKKTTTFFASKLKNEDKYFYIWGNLESNFFPRGIFQKGPISITLNGVWKYFIVTLVKIA